MSARPAQDAEPLVTAVLVCWNHERFVGAAIRSVLEQTYARIQLIVVDNGSVDGSRREIEALRARHGFTVICNDTNLGLVAALNSGLALAQGEFFAVLATDDMWLPEKTSLQVNYFVEHSDVHLLAGQIESIDSEGNFSRVRTVKRWGEPTFQSLMTESNWVSGPTIMCRTATLRELGGYDTSCRIEDYPLVLKLTYRGLRVVVLPDVLTLYRSHATNWTKSIGPEFYEVGAPYRHTPEYRGFYQLHFPDAVWRLVREGKKREAWQTVLHEPVPWTWKNMGRGIFRMLIPYALIEAYRSLKRTLSSRGEAA
jgi:glycosyltransferase involved in cell wall biosynthesis